MGKKRRGAIPYPLSSGDLPRVLDQLPLVVFASDLKGAVTYVNAYGQRYMDRVIGKNVLGKPFAKYIAPESLDTCIAALRQLNQGKVLEPYEASIVAKRGRRVPWLVSQSLVRRDRKVLGTLGVAIDISDKYRRESEIKQRVEEISTLNRVAEIINQTKTLDQVLKDTIEKILEITASDAGGICLLDEKRKALILKVHRGLSRRIVGNSTALKVGEGVSGKVAQTNRPVVFEDLAAVTGGRSPLLINEGFRSGGVVPIAIKGRVLGVFNILARRPRRYSRNEINLLVSIGTQIGFAIENFNLISARDKEIARLNVLNRISRIISSEISLDHLLERVYQQVKSILPADNFCIALHNAITNRFDVLLKYEKGRKQQRYSFPADRGLSSRVFSGKKPVLTDDYACACRQLGVRPYGRPTKAWMGVPIIEKGKPLGCIYVYDYRRKGIFDANDLELLTTIAGQTAVVIENVRHYKMLKERVEELELLFEVGQSVVSIVELDSVLKQIIFMMKKKFGHSKCAILLLDEKTGEPRIRAGTEAWSNRIRNFGSRVESGGITGHVLRSGKTHYAPDVRKDRYYIELSPRTRSEIAVPLKVGGRVTGILVIEADVANAFSSNDIRTIESICYQAAIAIENARLYASLEQSYLNTIRTLVSAMEAKDVYTSGHSERVRELSMEIAERMGLDTGKIKVISYAGYLHDIGKIGISDTLLFKTDPLSLEEMEKIKLHPVIGHNMISHLDFLKEVSRIIRHEHEKYDGSGYPDKLRGERIPLGARIMAVADAYDAMVTDRPYRKALTREEAIRRLKENAGTQFDPRVVAVFLKITGNR